MTIYPKIQYGSGKGQGTVDMIFVSCQLQVNARSRLEVCVYIIFVDPTKAFGAVSCEGLWKIMAELDCLEKFICIVPQFNSGMFSWILDNG